MCSLAFDCACRWLSKGKRSSVVCGSSVCVLTLADGRCVLGCVCEQRAQLEVDCAEDTEDLQRKHSCLIRTCIFIKIYMESSFGLKFCSAIDHVDKFFPPVKDHLFLSLISSRHEAGRQLMN